MVSKQNVGASGKRRIVPMMGIDYIAGNIETKEVPHPRYGSRLASIGGRTRRWSTINFLQVNPAGRTYYLNQNQIRWNQEFKKAAKSALATLANLSVRVAIQQDWLNKAIRQDVRSALYATMRGWITAVRIAQIHAGVEITETTNTWEWT